MPVSRKKMYLIFVLLALIGLLFIALSLDFGGSLVREQTEKAFQENLRADITMAEVKGNPFRGYRLEQVTLLREGKSILSADNIRVKPAVMSLLSGTPRLTLLEIEGFKSDVSNLNKLLGNLELKGGRGEIPLDEIRFMNSALSSVWAEAEIREVSFTFTGNTIDSGVDLLLNGMPVKGAISVVMDGKAISLGDLDLAVGEGNISARGDIIPDMKLEGTLSDIVIQEVVSFWPDVDPSAFEGKFSSSFQGEGTWENPNISGEFTFTGARIINLPFNKAEARWRYHEDRLDLADLDASVLGFPLKGNMAFVFRDAPARLLLDLEGSQVDLSSVRQISPAFKDLDGVIDRVKLDLSGMVSKLDGKIELEAGAIKWRAYGVNDSSVILSISKGDMQIQGKTLFNKAPVSFQGRINSFITEPSIDLSGNVRNLEISSLQSVSPQLEKMAIQGKVNADVRAKGKPHDMAISGKAWSDSLSSMKEKFGKTSLSFTYGKDRFSFSDLDLTWRGADISGQGSVSAISTEKKILDAQFNARELDSSFFSGFYPGIRDYAMEGKVSAQILLKGDPGSPVINARASSGSIRILDNYAFRDASISTELKGLPSGIPDVMDLLVETASASLVGIPVTDISFTLQKQGDRLNLTRGSALLGGGNISSGGTIELAVRDKTIPSLDLTFKADNIDLDQMSRAMDKPLPLSGSLSGEVEVRGPVSDPSFIVRGSSSAITLSGVTFQDLSTTLSGSRDKITISDLQASAGGGSLEVTGDFNPVDRSADMKVNARDLDLEEMTRNIPKAREFGVAGKITAYLDGHFEEGNNSGTGSLNSPLISVMGVRITNISYPISIKGEKILANGGRATLYGGNVKGDASLDIRTLRFNEDIAVEGADVNALLKDAFAIQGNVHGKAQAFVKITGSIKENLTYSGKGLLKVGEGEITGFRGIDILTKLHGIQGIRYESVYAPFNLETGRVILQRETIAQAFEGDPLYRFMKAEGPVGPEGKLDLVCQGNVNIQLLNVIMGGTAGGITSERSLEGILKGVIQGASGEMEKADFRDISFNVAGFFSKPKVSGLKIAPSSETAPAGEPEDTKPVAPEVTSPTTTTGSEIIPPQKDTEEKDVKEEIKKEILKKIFQ